MTIDRPRARLLVAVALLAAVDPVMSSPLLARDLFFGFGRPRRARHAALPHVRPAATAPTEAEPPLPPPRPRSPGASAPAPEPPTAQAPVPPSSPAAETPAPPALAPSGARVDDAPRQPADDATCPARLRASGVDAEPAVLAPQPDPRCTVVQAVRLRSITLRDGSVVETPDHPTIACTTAETFSRFVRDLVAPLAKGTYDTTVTSIWTGPGLECRARDHIAGAKLSAHGQGLAVDVAQLRFASGRTTAVGDPKSETDVAFETATRAGACGYFHTVLGPGSDSYHRNHWHFDLLVRGTKGDSKFCQ